MKRYLRKLGMYLSYCFLLVTLSSGLCRSNAEEIFAALSEEIKAQNMNNNSTGNGGNNTGSTSCPKQFDSYTNDAQLDAYCGYAWMYRCQQGKSLNDPAVKAVCTYYNDLKTSSAPSCPYCR